ncbi:MAG: UDP-N-acetylmuramate--L-alanine ligase [Candidatus Colwellbacteria bacterium]|nr:UDP-N-acetylmuramate--L-alanine ligase [Candidatus Colwellbacteria bacterium]
MKDTEKIINSGNNVYVVGIKGAGVAGLAQFLKGRGYKISGSDTKEKFFTDALLKKAHIPYREGFSTKNIPHKIDWVLASNAYISKDSENPEIKALRRRKIPIFSYPEVLSYFFNKSYGIAIAGTHGKTTTSAAIAHILKTAGMRPSALIGGEVINWKSNTLTGKSNIFVIEADEYKDAFLNYRPNVIVILNTDWDHPDYFRTHKKYLISFKKFKRNLKPGGRIFEPRNFIKIKLPANPRIAGEHNKYNLKAAVAVTKHLGVKNNIIKKAIANFKGTQRRLEVVGKLRGNILVDDYAHNSQKVEASINALRDEYPNKEITVVFQPHTYTRTVQFLEEFARALILADNIFLLDIYSSAREKKGKITSNDLMREVIKLGKLADNLRTVSAAVRFFKKWPRKNQVIVAMGAGDVGALAHKLKGV